MVQGRKSAWPLLCAVACLLLLVAVPPLLVDDFWGPGPNGESRDLDRSGTRIPAPSPELYSLAEAVGDAPLTRLQSDSRSAAQEPPAPTEAQPLEVAARIGALAGEPAVPEAAAADGGGPSLTVAEALGLEAAPVAVVSESSEQDGPLFTVQESARFQKYFKTPEEQPRPAPIDTALLPNWVRRLPAIVAGGIRATQTSLPSAGARYPETDAETSSIASPEPAPEAAARQRDDSWPEPTALIERLRRLAGNDSAGRWADAALRHVIALAPAAASGSDESSAILVRLEELERRVETTAATTADKTRARNLRRAGYALGRRIDLWRQVVRPGTPRLGEIIPVDRNPSRLAACVKEIESVTGDSTEGRAWREYLLTDALKEYLTPPPDDDQLRLVARLALVRLTQTPLTPGQQEFVSDKAVAALQDELCLWAAEPISAAALLRDVERYEQTGLPSDAQRLAADYRCLAASTAKQWRAAAVVLDSHYRNANFRLAVTEQLLNDLMPEQNLEYARVNDRVLGHPTWGESLMATEAAIRMQPDPKRVRLVLEVNGEIASVTTSDAGIAQFHSNSEAYYSARKPLEVDLHGISLWPAEVKVYNDSRLRGVDTSMDAVPLLNWVFEGVARSQAEQNKPAANREVRGKVAARAKQRIDAEVHKQFSGVVERLNRRVFDPLNSLTLDPQLIEAETTETRFTMRLRLAGEDQLGSHTPRPRAPSDSLASVQLHETVLNNGVQRLQLAGRTFTLPELAEHISARLSCPPPWDTIPDNENVKITFARKDPVVVRCEDGRAVITLSIHRLSKSPRAWKDFQIRAFYRPEIAGRSAQLVRDGVIQLIGDRLTVGSQIALRGIFSHVLAQDAPLTLVNNAAVNDRKLENAEFTQFIIDDGWIGIALGPKSSLARRPKTGQRAD